jgi:hypothetical protein
MRLYWTPARDVPGAKSTGKYQPQTETLALPVEFWNDLKQILGLLTQSRIAALTVDQSGHYVADRLAPLIAQVRALVQSREGVWKPETLAGSSSAWPLRSDNTASSRERMNRWPKASSFIARFWAKEPANACRSNGPGPRIISAMRSRNSASGRAGRRGSTRPSPPFATPCRKELARAPLDWAMTQTNLGFALFRLGERESGTARLEEAAAYREALQESTRARATRMGHDPE